MLWQRGFTLLELCFIIALLGVLALLASEIFTTTYRVTRGTSQAEDSVLQFDRIVGRLRRLLDLDAMRAGLAHLAGQHDFTSFRGQGCTAKTAAPTKRPGPSSARAAGVSPARGST